jgi:hypothetical protein
MSGISLQSLIRKTLNDFEIDLHRDPKIFGLAQERVVRNALGEISENLVDTIGKYEGAFRNATWNLSTARATYLLKSGRATKADFVAAILKVAKWIANVRNFGSRYR